MSEAKNPKLGNCKTCGKEVSRTAKVCPHCGEEKPVPSSGSGCGFLIVIGLVLGVSAIQISNQKTYKHYRSDESEQTSSVCGEVVCNSAWDGSVRQVEHYLKDALKDPDSMKDAEWGPVLKTESGFMVSVQYRAKNSFGAYVPNKQAFLLDKAGKVVDVVDLQN